MSIISRIEECAYEYAKLGLNTPSFVFVSPDVYTALIKESMNLNPITTSTDWQMSTNWQMFTSVGCLDIRVSKLYPKGVITVGDYENPVVSMLHKLGDIF